MTRQMIETVEAFDSREGIDVEAFLAFADRVRDMAGVPGPGVVLDYGTLTDAERAEVTRRFEQGAARPSTVIVSPSGLGIVLTATTTMRGRIRRLTAKVEHKS